MHNFNLKNSLKLGYECYHNSFQKLVHKVYCNKFLKIKLQNKPEYILFSLYKWTHNIFKKIKFRFKYFNEYCELVNHIIGNSYCIILLDVTVIIKVYSLNFRL